MQIITKAELESFGMVVNPNMWLGDAFFYCYNCKQYQYHYAMSFKSMISCYEVCEKCQCYSGLHTIDLTHHA